MLRVIPTHPVPALEAGLVVAWSSGFIGATLAAQTGAPFAVLFWRMAVATLVLLPLAMPALLRMRWQDIATQASVGALAMFAYPGGVFAATMLGVPAGTAALVTALQPLATAAVAGVLLGEANGPRQWIGLAVGLGGVGVSVAGGIGTAPPLGFALAFLAMSALVAGTLLAKAQTRTGPPLLPSLTIQCAVAGLLFAPLAAVDGGPAPGARQAFVEAVAWLTLLSTFGAYGLYWAVLARTSATRVASLIYLTPPVTALWALAMFAEPITAAAVAGRAMPENG